MSRALIVAETTGGQLNLSTAKCVSCARELDDTEVDAIRNRAAWCVKERRFPTDDSGRRYPWPLV